MEISYVCARARPRAHLRALITRKSCAVGMRNAKNYKIARNYLTYTLDFIVVQMSSVSREKGYCHCIICVPANFIPYHVTGSCKEPI